MPTSHARHPPRCRATRATGPAPPAPAGRRHRGTAGDVPVSQSSLALPHSQAARVSLPRRFPVLIPFRNAAARRGLWIPPGEPGFGRPRHCWRGNAFGTRAAARQSPPGLGSALCFPPPPSRKIKSRFPKVPPAQQTPACPSIGLRGGMSPPVPSGSPPSLGEPQPSASSSSTARPGRRPGPRWISPGFCEVCVDRAGKRGWDSGWRSTALAGALPAALEAAGLYPARCPPGI